MISKVFELNYRDKFKVILQIITLDSALFIYIGNKTLSFDELIMTITTKDNKVVSHKLIDSNGLNYEKMLSEKLGKLIFNNLLIN